MPNLPLFLAWHGMVHRLRAVGCGQEAVAVRALSVCPFALPGLPWSAVQVLYQLLQGVVLAMLIIRLLNQLCFQPRISIIAGTLVRHGAGRPGSHARMQDMLLRLCAGAV